MTEPSSPQGVPEETAHPIREITFRFDERGLKDMIHNATVHDTDLLCIAAWCMTVIRDAATNKADHDRAARILADITGKPVQKAGQG
ncbi:MAG TPA: hypothetical protein VME69_04250 [Methylocella sp.]|nr:hypothetical protein [Methylocella sp.]